MEEIEALIDKVRNGKEHTALRSDKPQEPKRFPLIAKKLDDPAPLVAEGELNDVIFIPEEYRGKRVDAFSISVRLRHVLAGQKIVLMGQLHKRSISDFKRYRNCGSTTIEELRNLVHAVQQALSTLPSASEVLAQTPADFKCVESFWIPPKIFELNPYELPISVRLEHALKRKGVKCLGDVHGLASGELRSLDNCGKRTVKELFAVIDRAATGAFNPPTQPFSLTDIPGMLDSIDRIIMGLPTERRRILLRRLGGKESEVATLEEIGNEFRLTRERVRQIVAKTLLLIQKEGGPKLVAELTGLASICRELICPLTPGLLSHWVGKASNRKFCYIFYVRLVGQLDSKIPAWPKNQEYMGLRSGQRGKIVEALEAILREGRPSLGLKEAFELTSRRVPQCSLDNFLLALRGAKRLTVEFQQPDRPYVKLRYLTVTTVARMALERSDAPLTPEEILEQAQQIFGAESVDWSPHGIGNSLTPEKGFYLLGPRAYGLHRHFRMAHARWRAVQTDAYEYLEKENRPISTAEIINRRIFVWTGEINAYELAQILREDTRFMDLGKFLFALAKWGMEEREYVKDLIPKVLSQVGHPITASDVAQQMGRFRSVSPTSASSMLRTHPLVRDYGFGHYGLKSWGNSVKGYIVADSRLVQRVIRRAVPPLTFARLCEILDLASDPEAADKLWQTCCGLVDVIRMPEEQSNSTRILHRSCRLERALVATAREVNRPLPLYEIQWELNERFGPLFAKRPSNELRRVLEQSPMFLRNAAGEFILEIHLDKLGIDTDAIRHACAEILTESKEIVGCEDLLERLEADGKSWPDLSADILASLLHDDARFEEVGHDRFRTKTCKR